MYATTDAIKANLTEYTPAAEEAGVEAIVFFNDAEERTQADIINLLNKTLKGLDDV